MRISKIRPAGTQKAPGIWPASYLAMLRTSMMVNSLNLRSFSHSDVNGSPIAQSAGGTNQLWLGSTSARYFARDITGITLEKRQTPPPAPGSDEADDEYANLPNVGVYFGGEIA